MKFDTAPSAKKLLAKAALATALLLATPHYAFAASTATLSIDPISGQFNQGCSVTVRVLLDTGGADTDGTDAIINYNPAVFNISNTSIQNGTIYADWPGSSVDQAAGKISISGLASISQAYKTTGQPGVLATLNFTVKSDAPTAATSLKFDFDPANPAKTTDSNVVQRGTIEDVLMKVNDGNYTIGTGACGTTTSTTTGVTTVGTGTKAPVGGTTVGSKTPVKYASPAALPQGGDSTTIMIFTVVGTALTILGILGLALL